MASNPLLSTSKSSGSSLHAALHPLVLLSISDYITRHTLRQINHPIVGALLGQQNGREVTIEHAYDIRLMPPNTAENESSYWRVHEAFFKDRLQQYKDVQKDPPLELVGWWTLTSLAGPPQEIMGIHEYIMENHNESALLLAFHPGGVKQIPNTNGSATGIKLPLTIFESVYESNKADPDANAMQIEVADGVAGESLQLRLREMPYEIATGEAEMISMDFVARGGGNATAIDDRFASFHAGKHGTAEHKNKEAVTGQHEGQKSYLNSEEEERESSKPTTVSRATYTDLFVLVIAFLSTRANAIKMLQSRVSLLKTRLTSLPTSYLTSVDIPIDPVPDPTSSDATPHQLLRATLALSAKLSLVDADDPSTLASEAVASNADTALIDLLATLGSSTRQARELGGRFAARDTGRRAAADRDGFPPPNAFFSGSDGLHGLRGWEERRPWDGPGGSGRMEL